MKSTNNKANEHTQDREFEFVILPPDMDQRMRDFCPPENELGVRMFAFRPMPEAKELIFLDFLTYEEHIAALALIQIGHHRHDAMELAHRGLFRANRGDEKTLLSGLVSAGSVDEVIGSLRRSGDEWTIWRSRAPVLGPALHLTFSAVRYHPGLGVAPW